MRSRSKLPIGSTRPQVISMRKCLAGVVLAIGESRIVQASTAAAILVASAVLPASGLRVPTCWWQTLFGFRCPGCGLTRSFIALGHGHIIEAFQFNWVGPFFFVLIAALLVDRIFQILVHRPAFPALERAKPFTLIFWALILSWPIQTAWHVSAR